MNIVIFCHPAFMSSQSMPKFANMLKVAYEQRGHQVAMWSPQAYFYNWVKSSALKKWAGYVDQYILFPRWVHKALNQQPSETLYVFADQALGPWVPLVRHLPHVVHAHDLLALRSALGDVPENPTSITGRIYQRYIRRGFRQARHFIPISHKTEQDLHQFGQVNPVSSTVVYNGMNFPYNVVPGLQARTQLIQAGLPAKPEGMLLHLGGSQWYKNLAGVIHIYVAYARKQAKPLPLWCISPPPNEAIKAILDTLPEQAEVLFFQGLDNETLQAAYSYAKAFLFPSLAEGFGWPLIEAQACGCLVLTTDEAPMNEVAGSTAYYVPLLKHDDNFEEWAETGALALERLLNLDKEQRAVLVERAIAWTAHFDADKAIEGYLRVYRQVLEGNSIEIEDITYQKSTS